MSGYQGRGGDYGRPDRYGGRESRDRRDDQAGNNQERRRSRSPGRDQSRGNIPKFHSEIICGWLEFCAND
jgi:hypothetical protein